MVDASTDVGEDPMDTSPPGEDTEPPGEDTGVDTGEPDDAGEEDAGPDDVGLGDPCEGPPGLYIDSACGVLAPGIRAFEPQFWLWSDGTDKERYILLPEGSQIDTRDADNWVYPVGTTVWKHFLRASDGKRLETRRFEKQTGGSGMDAWRIQTFVWNDAGDTVTEVMTGMDNVLGTDHDIPSISDCLRCHADRAPPDLLLGFTAIQLNHTGSDTSLADLRADDLLSNDVPLDMARVPGTEVEREALGYLHANCSHCHGGIAPQAGMNLRLTVGLTNVSEANAYMTAVGVRSGWQMGLAVLRVEPQFPERSTVYLRMGIRDPGPPFAMQMPPLATEIPDMDGRAAVFDWISALPPAAPPDAGM